jgi:hypothetical protein
MATTRKLIIIGALLALASCSCEKTEPAKGLVKKAVVKKKVTPPKPLPSVKDQMRKIQRFTRELRRRVRGNVSVAGPTKVIRATLKGMPINRYPKNFKMFYNSMVARTEAMLISKNLGSDYNKLVDRCVACHVLHAQHYMGVKRLRLPKDQWPTTPQVKKKRPGPKGKKQSQ